MMGIVMALGAFLLIFLILLPIAKAAGFVKGAVTEFKKPIECDEYNRVIDPQTGKARIPTKKWLKSQGMTAEEYEIDFIKTHKKANENKSGEQSC